MKDSNLFNIKSDNISTLDNKYPDQSKNNGNSFVAIIFTAIIIVAIPFILSMPAESPSGAIKRTIKESAYWPYSSYVLGRFIDIQCRQTEYSGINYLIRCDYSYYPRNGYGSIMLNTVDEDTIYACLIKSSDGKKFDYSFSKSYWDAKDDCGI